MTPPRNQIAQGDAESYAAFLASKRLVDVATGIVDAQGDPAGLYPFQQAIVRWALRRGRAAVFADTGLGKTRIQVAWANRVSEHCDGPVLILAPLCVAQQTVREAHHVQAHVDYVRGQAHVNAPGVYITNYEMVGAFNLERFCGIVLDESSILKSVAGKTRADLLARCQNIPFRLSCTATPSPNDYMEFGGQAEFLGVMSQAEMLAMFFTHDGGNTSQWRLKGHGRTRFWEWLATWAAVVKKPSDLGYSDAGYDLPPIQFHQHIVDGSETPEGLLFPMEAETLSERISARRATVASRARTCAEIVNADSEQWIVWCNLNDESRSLERLINGAVAIEGAHSLEEKETRMQAFLDGSARVLVTKPSIAGFGLNMQHCARMAFVGLSDSYEQFYQALRRCWRFGQTRQVQAHIIVAEIEGAVLANIQRKERQAQDMNTEMAQHMGDLTRKEIEGASRDTAPHRRDIASGENWTMHLGDCIEVLREQADASVDYSIFSPPFSSLYTYSNSERDMGNAANDGEFMQHFGFLVRELFRVTTPGRDLSFHCMNLPTSKQMAGFIGIRDFRGELIRLFQQEGWIYHSEVVIWKDPVTAMQRTKALGLLHKTIRRDSSMARQGIPDYLITMRKPGVNPKPISHDPKEFPVSLWQRYASPVWMDIDASRTLNRAGARENDDERHIAPLQLDVIERAIMLWSAPGDLVLSPFAGIGSEGYMALKMGRRFIGAELKRSYWELACRHLAEAATERQIALPVE